MLESTIRHGSKEASSMHDSPAINDIDPAVWEGMVRQGKALVQKQQRLRLELGNLVLEALGPCSEDDEDLLLFARQVGMTPATLSSLARLAASSWPPEAQPL
ncbi:hypothetical protein ACFCV8_07850 [Streptomyces sp. NPDC056347]|uniref:hypothetical protein n=1 Tax=Streptomyces sp. NPDC056347 TaxID=3345790 RepID=UPI0035D69017